MEIFIEFDIVKRDMLIYRYKNEFIKLFQKQQNGDNVSNERLAELELILKTYNNSIRHDYDKFLTALDDVNDLYLSQPWNKICEFNKIRKITEYCNEQYNGDLKNNICADLIKLVKLKKLGKKNEIIYNKDLKKITSIPVVKIYNDNTYNIKIK